jgi:hypothetical protein
MYGSQPETQMLQLWSNHRRRTAYTVQSVAATTHNGPLIRLTRTIAIWGLLLGLLVISLAGCVTHYPAYGYGHGYNHYQYQHGYHGDYGRRHWHGRSRHNDDD